MNWRRLSEYPGGPSPDNLSLLLLLPDPPPEQGTAARLAPWQGTGKELEMSLILPHPPWVPVLLPAVGQSWFWRAGCWEVVPFLKMLRRRQSGGKNAKLLWGLGVGVFFGFFGVFFPSCLPLTRIPRSILKCLSSTLMSSVKSAEQCKQSHCYQCKGSISSSICICICICIILLTCGRCLLNRNHRHASCDDTLGGAAPTGDGPAGQTALQNSSGRRDV